MNTDSIKDARIAKGFEYPPYNVETYSGNSCVVNKHGFNVLTFASKPGAVFTSLQVAQVICDLWNKKENK